MVAALSHDSASSIPAASNDPSAAIKADCSSVFHKDFARGATEKSAPAQPNGASSSLNDGTSCHLQLATAYTAKPDWLGVFAILLLASYVVFSLVFCSWLSLVMNASLAAALCYVAPTATGITKSSLRLKASSLVNELAMEKCRVGALSTEISRKDSTISGLSQKVVKQGKLLMESSELVKDLEKQLEFVDETLLRARLAALVHVVAVKSGLNLEFKGIVGKGGFSHTVLATMATPTSKTKTEVVLKIANGTKERRAVKEEASKLAFLNSLPGSDKHVIKLVHDKCVQFRYSGDAATGAKASESLYAVIIIEKAGADLAKHFDDNVLTSPRPYLGCGVNSGSLSAPDDAPSRLLQVATLFRSWDSTLAWLHSHGIAHLDIKPANAVIMTTGAASMLPADAKAGSKAMQLVPAPAEVKLIDFAGMCLPDTARAPTSILSTGPTDAAPCWNLDDGRHGTVHVTEKFMQPEQFRPGATAEDGDDETWLVDCTYDRWSLGMSMLTLICPQGSSCPAEEDGPEASELSPILNLLSSRTCSPEELGQLVSARLSSGILARDLRQSVAAQARGINDGFLVDYITRIVERNLSQGMGLMR